VAIICQRIIANYRRFLKMILNKNTRNIIKNGMVLKSVNENSKSYRYRITNILEYGKGCSITVQIISTDEWNNRQIYLQPLSNYYGLEIIEG
jgi:hypothetical protein